MDFSGILIVHLLKTLNMKSDKKTTKDAINRTIETDIDPGRTEENLEQNEKMTNKYTDGKGELADSVREMNPNRNVDKEDATNAGGYKQ